MFKLGIRNDLGISYKWLGLSAIRHEFKLYECLLVLLGVSVYRTCPCCLCGRVSVHSQSLCKFHTPYTLQFWSIHFSFTADFNQCLSFSVCEWKHLQILISGNTKLWRVKMQISAIIIQEGWLSPTERASVSAISLRHIIWLPHESHAGMSLPSAVLRWRHLAASRESKAYFGLPWVRPWDSRGKCYMNGKRIQCL